MQDIRRNDTVELITGDDRGKRGRVLRVSEGKALVEGVNYIWRHVRPSQKNPQGGRVQKEAPVAVSNVMVVCAECDKPRKISHKGEGRAKIRVCKACGQEIKAAGK